MRWVIVVSVLVLTACAPRHSLQPLPPGAAAGSVRNIYVATTRAAEVDGSFGRSRADDLDYLRIDVSVPPDRSAGEIRTPRRFPDPEVDFLVSSSAKFSGGSAFTGALRQALRQARPADREILIYVHGYNNVFPDGVLRMAQLSEDIGLNGVQAHFAWPSEGNAFGYVYDRESVLFSRDGLERMIREAHAAGPRRLILVAHSMGSLLVMETLRQMSLADPGSASRLIDGVVLMSPDLDVQLFRQQAQTIGTLPDPFYVFTSEEDRILGLSSLVSGQPDRLGNLISPNEVADLNVVILDVSVFSSGAGHFTVGDSSALLAILGDAREVSDAFDAADAARAGILPGTAIRVQNATQVVLNPGSALGQ